MEYDVLIVGAGLAGCTCAYALANAGVRVLAIDRANLLTKEKLCGGVLTPRAMSALKRVYGDSADAIARDTHMCMRVLFGPYDETVGGIRAYGMRRADLDRYALERALEAGADILDCARLDWIDFYNGRARILMGPKAETRTGETGGPDAGVGHDARRCAATDSKTGTGASSTGESKAFELSFRVLVAADGAMSQVRRLACLETDGASAEDGASTHAGATPFTRPIPAALVPSLEAPARPNGLPFTCEYNARLHGYGWYIPYGNTAVIGYDSARGASAAELRAELRAFAHRIGAAYKESAVRGAFIPRGDTVLLQWNPTSNSSCGNIQTPARHYRPCAHPVYFLGDAAGLAAPATGEGIYFAVRSAELLAREIAGGTGGAGDGGGRFRALPYSLAMGREAAVLAAQYRALGVLFDERIMYATTETARAMGIGANRMARFAMKLFASF